LTKKRILRGISLDARKLVNFVGLPCKAATLTIQRTSNGKRGEEKKRKKPGKGGNKKGFKMNTPRFPFLMNIPLAVYWGGRGKFLGGGS